MKATVVVLTQTTGFLNHLKPLLCYVMLYRPIYHRIASANQKAARNWRANYQPISVERGTRAQSISQSEGCQERARTPTNQSASKNRANADQSERLQERPRKSANQSACRNRANASQSECLQERAAQGLEHLQNEGHKY